MGVGIDVMKAHGGGDLLSHKTSPFGKAMPHMQAILIILTNQNWNNEIPAYGFMHFCNYVCERRRT